MTQRSFSADQSLAQAKALANQGQVEAAKRLYGQILAQFPQHKKARKELRALQERADSRLSREDFERVMRLVSSGKLDAAESDASSLARKHPGQPALHNLLGVILTRRSKLTSAVEHFRKALALQPDFVDALNNLGAAYAKLGHAAEAERCYKSLLHASTRDPDTWYNLGNAQRNLKKFEDAAASYRQSLQLRPLSPEAHLNLGKTYLDLGDPQRAIGSFQDALGIKDSFLPARQQLASAYFNQGKVSRAGDCYKQILKVRPDDTQALLGLANCQRSLGVFTAAAETYSRVLELNPGSATARHHLDAIQHRRSDRAPEDYVRSVFNAYAPGFEQHLTGALGYNSPSILRALGDTLDMGTAIGGAAVDLGCGTGLAGVAFRDQADSLLGIDLSPGMLREADKKRVYDRLLEGDIVKTLHAQSDPFNLLLCCDTLVYIGKLEPLFAAVSDASAPGARFLFTTEHLDQGDFELLQTGRYAHSQAYIEACAAKAGLELLHFEESQPRKEQGDWLNGGLYCLAKPA